MNNPRPKILIIDDIPDNLLMLGTALATDFDLQIVTSGAEGLAQAAQSPPDLILLDAMMPDMDGYETCRRLKADAHLQTIPVIFVTALTESEDEFAGLAMGAVDYIAKPVNAIIARQRIRNLLERERLRKEIEAHRDQLEELVQARTRTMTLAQAALRESEARYERAIHGANNGIWEWNFITGQDYQSPRWKQLLGYEDHELPTHRSNFTDRLHPEDQPRIMAAVRLHFEERKPYWNEVFRLRCKSGEYRWFSSRGQAEWDDQGQPMRVTGSISDITEHKRAEMELRVAAIAFESQTAMLITDSKSMILRINQAFTQLTGYDETEAVSRTPALLKSGCHDKKFYQRLWVSLKEKGHWQGAILNKYKNGLVYADWLTISAVIDPNGDATHYIGRFSDIAMKQRMDVEIHRLPYYDTLTQLPNRRLLQDHLEQAVADAARSGHYGAILFLDLDNFKALNHAHGWEIGDLLLIEVAQRLRTIVREIATIARVGGDAFVVLLENLGKDAGEAADKARQLGEKLDESLSRRYSLKGRECDCTTRMVACLFSGQDAVDALLRLIDLINLVPARPSSFWLNPQSHGLPQ
ncbi:histidine kinase [Gammaproteobacteria bacterium]